MVREFGISDCCWWIALVSSMECSFIRGVDIAATVLLRFCHARFGPFDMWHLKFIAETNFLTPKISVTDRACFLIGDAASINIDSGSVPFFSPVDSTMREIEWFTLVARSTKPFEAPSFEQVRRSRLNSLPTNSTECFQENLCVQAVVLDV